MLRPRRVTALALAATALVALGACGPSSFDDIAAQAVKDGLPGIALYVRSAANTWTGVAGVANLQTGAKLAPDDRFLLVGPSGLMVATAAMRLVEAGALRLDDPVTATTGLDGVYGIPEISRIAVRNALNHSTGLLDPFTLYAFLQRVVGGDAAIGAKFTPRDGLKELTTVGTRPLFRPGQGVNFSAGNTTLLGLAIEGTAKKPLAEVLQEQIFAPAGMARAVLAGFDPRGGVMVPGYDLATQQLRYLGISAKLPQPKPGFYDTSPLSPTWAWAAGGVAAPIGDLGRFAEALFGGKLVKPETLRQMATFGEKSGAGPQGDPVEFGLGLMRRKVGGDYAIGFEGETLGYAALVYNFPDLNVTIAAAANGSGTKANLIQVLAQVHDLIKARGNTLFAAK